jgi:hypothetical protein
MLRYCWRSALLGTGRTPTSPVTWPAVSRVVMSSDLAEGSVSVETICVPVLVTVSTAELPADVTSATERPAIT